jgi:ribosomal protein S18 acetylase RimI-like enzyme
VTRDNDEALEFYESIGCEKMGLHVLGKVIK